MCFWHCPEWSVQVEEVSIRTGTAEASHEWSEPRRPQMGTTGHEQNIKQPRPSGRRAPCPWLLSQRDGPWEGRTIALLNTDTNSAFSHRFILKCQQVFLQWDIHLPGGEVFFLHSNSCLQAGYSTLSLCGGRCEWRYRGQKGTLNCLELEVHTVTL